MMGLIVSEVYDALIEAGASPETAKAAAGAVPPAENMVTTEDLARLEARMATKEDLAKLEAATKEALARLEARLDKVEANMVTKEEFSRLEGQIAVLRFAVFSFGPAIVALLVKLTFFP